MRWELITSLRRAAVPARISLRSWQTPPCHDIPWAVATAGRVAVQGTRPGRGGIRLRHPSRTTSQGEWQGLRFIPARPHRCMPGRRHDVSRRRSTGWAGCSSSGDGRVGRSLAGGSGIAHGLYPASPSSYAVPTAWCRRLRSAGQGTAGPGGRRHTEERNLHGDAAVGRG